MSEGKKPKGPVVLLTGANGVIGKAIARQLAVVPGVDLVLACRREGPAKELVKELERQAPGARVRYVLSDLSRKQPIYELAQSFEGRLTVLINNAAQSPKKRTLTSDGIETQFATNVLGYVWMMEAFAPLLEQNRPSRIVNVASYWAGDLDLADLQFERRAYDNNAAYRQSKQAERMLTVAYAERFKSRGISVNACHPGDVSSKLSNDLGFGGSMTADECARTPVWLATDPTGVEQTGGWFASRRREACGFARNTQAIAELDATCRSYL